MSLSFFISPSTNTETQKHHFDLCSQGFKHFGINRGNGVTTYREWVPAAQAVALIGDFSGWQEVR